MIRILVVDDHAVVREGLCRLLDGEDDIEVIGQAGTGREALEICERLKPEVVLLDYSLPDMDGLEATSRIISLKTGARILVLTMHASEEYAIRLIRAGAAGFARGVADRGSQGCSRRLLREFVHPGENGRPHGPIRGRSTGVGSVGSGDTGSGTARQGHNHPGDFGGASPEYKHCRNLPR